MFVAIGAQAGKTLRIEGEDAGNVFSAVEMLDGVGNGRIPDYSGKAVVVVGGGNVAMDAARTAVRCGAKDVSIVYRRRKDDMTALQTEIESAVEEGIGMLMLRAPLSIEKDADRNCSALIVQPQMTGLYRDGRPAPMKADKPPERIPGDVILIAVGQDIVSAPFADFGMETKRGAILAGDDTAVKNMPGIFAGGDCATRRAKSRRITSTAISGTTTRWPAGRKCRKRRKTCAFPPAGPSSRNGRPMRESGTSWMWKRGFHWRRLCRKRTAVFAATISAAAR